MLYAVGKKGRITHPSTHINILVILCSVPLFVVFLYAGLSCGKNSRQYAPLLDEFPSLNPALAASADSSVPKSPVLVIALSGHPSTLDPQKTISPLTTLVTSNIYDTLVSQNNALPSLAESWERSEDGLRWTFSLKEDILFHNGKRFLAEDVLASFQRIRTLGITHPFFVALDNFEAIELIDDSTILFVLKKYDAAMPATLAQPYFSIFPSDLISGDHNFDTSPVGTGPYEYQFEKEKRGIVLSRNEEYTTHHQPHTQLDSETSLVQKILFYTVSDNKETLERFLEKEIDVIPYPNNVDVQSIRRRNNFSILTKHNSSVIVLAMNTRKPPFDDIEKRTQIARNINKDEVISAAYPRAIRTNILWYTDSPYYLNIPEIHDAQADNQVFDLDKGAYSFRISVQSNELRNVIAAKNIVSQLNDTELNVSINSVGSTQWLEYVYGKGNFDAIITSLDLGLDPYAFLKMFQTPNNLVGFKEPTLTDLLLRIPTEVNQETITQVYQDAFSALTQSYAFVVLAQNTDTLLVQNHISNIEFNPIFNTYNLNNATKVFSKK